MDYSGVWQDVLYLAKHCKTGELFAVKEIRKEKRVAANQERNRGDGAFESRQRGKAVFRFRTGHIDFPVFAAGIYGTARCPVSEYILRPKRFPRE